MTSPHAPSLTTGAAAPMPLGRRPRVVVVGAGFGGLAASRALGGAGVDVTLVDRNNFHTFQPLLYQVATAGLNAADVAHAVRGIVREQPDVTFRRATVTGVDWDTGTDAGGRVLVDHGPALPFDRLVVAAGATADYFGIPGAQKHGRPLYTLADATSLRNHVLGRFEAADADPALVDDGALTFVVVGGGPTGVEVAGALAELITMVLRRDFARLDVGRARIVLVEMVDDLLTGFRPESRRHALEALVARGVEVRTGTRVVEITPTRVHLRSGEDHDDDADAADRVLPAHTLVWAAGVRASAVTSVLGVELGRGGRIVVGPDCRIAGRTDAYAIGDGAAITLAGGQPAPGVAQIAIQSGQHAAKEIIRSLRGERTGAPFRYRDKGSMATIGRRAAVAELPLGVTLSGAPAWLAWLGLHLVYLIGFRNRLSVLFAWAWNYLTWDRGPRLIFEQHRTSDEMETELS
jgi:NADH dehydrogenase